MKVVFAGTPAFAAQALSAVIAAGFEVSLVLTQPDRPAGRGMQPQSSPVKTTALANRIEVFQPQTLRDTDAQNKLRDIGADVMVVAAYGLILPAAVLSLPPFGCINIHASLLPRWRGAAPIQRALLAGDRNSGISIMQMDEGLDTGAIIAMGETPISDTETAATLHDKLAAQGAEMIVTTLRQLSERGSLATTPQPEAGVTYAEKIRKEEAVIDWHESAQTIERKIRAFNPFPGAATVIDGIAVKIWQASIVADGAGIPGRILEMNDNGIVVTCGSAAIRVEMLQKAGGKKLSVQQFLSGFPLTVGGHVGS